MRHDEAVAAREVYAADAGIHAAAAFADLIVSFLAQSAAGTGPVAPARTPEELAERFAEPLPRHGRPLSEVLARVERDILADANHLNHPMYLGHQVSAPVPTAVWTDAVIAAANNSIAVNEMSPTLSHVERRVIRWFCELIGWGPEAGGTFTSGGTEASFSALLAARANRMPEAWANGVGTNPPVLVCSQHTHYAISRAAGEMGLGSRQVVLCPDQDYRMSPVALHATLQRLTDEGRAILAVCATAGQTATGSFDDLSAIADVCEQFGVWLHVDGAHGASALLSAKHKHRLRGIERVHSIAWDPHKMMLLPLAAGTVLVREARWLDQAFTQRAPYLFHDANVVNWNIGVRSFQCSRRADALKAWVTLQRFGADGVAAWYDLLCALAMQLHDRLVAHPRFEVLHVPDCNILCFRWVGDGTYTADALDTLNLTLRERYNASGEGWITATVLEGRRVLRVTVQNPRTTEEHLDRLIDGLDRLAHELTRRVQ